MCSQKAETSMRHLIGVACSLSCFQACASTLITSHSQMVLENQTSAVPHQLIMSCIICRCVLCLLRKGIHQPFNLPLELNLVYSASYFFTSLISIYQTKKKKNQISCLFLPSHCFPTLEVRQLQPFVYGYILDINLEISFTYVNYSTCN